MGGPPTDPVLWAGLDELTAEFDWDCPHCAARLDLDVRAVEVGPEGAVNVLEAWCEVVVSMAAGATWRLSRIMRQRRDAGTGEGQARSVAEPVDVTQQAGHG